MKSNKKQTKQMLKQNKYKKDADSAFLRLFASSIMGILLCIVCMGGLTWAWFNQSVTGNTESIHSASYSISISVVQNPTTDNITVSPGADGKYSLAAGNSYKVTLSASEDATTGYCKVTVNGTDYHTTQMAPVVPGNRVIFTIKCTAAATVEFSPNWMTYSGYSESTTDLIGQNISEIEITSEGQTVTKSAE